MTATVRWLFLVCAACSSATAPTVRAPAPPAPVATKQATLEIPAPWRDLDFRATDDEIERQFAAAKAPDCAQGTYRSGGLCWGSDDRTGDQVITVHFDSPEQAFTRSWGAPVFESTDDDDETWRTWHVQAGSRRIAATQIERSSTSMLVLEELLPLRETVPWMKSLVGLPHDAVTRKVGKRGSHRQPVCEGILCFYTLPPNEGGDVNGSIEFADGVASRVSYVMSCGRDCKLGGAILAAFDTAFGARKTTSRPYEETGELWTYHSYASSPGLVVKSREHLPDTMFVCVGACD